MSEHRFDEHGAHEREVEHAAASGSWTRRRSRRSDFSAIMRVRIAGQPGSLASARTLPGWRNGRRSGLKIRRWQQREGSTPFPGTIVATAARAEP